MGADRRKKWLVLIHQIPTKPDALRVKTWRRLQQIGAVAIKQSVYVMPFSEQSREDLSWTLKEIVGGGGDGSISEVRFVEGVTDEQVVSLFQNARDVDYDNIIRDAEQILSDWSADSIDPKDPSRKAKQQVLKLRRQYDSIVAIDFFNAPQGESADLLVQGLVTRTSDDGKAVNAQQVGFDGLKGKVWVTRRGLFVDRIACGWLIRRFVDENADFKYVDSDAYSPMADEIRFDMFEGEYTHEGDCCTFEVMIKRFGLNDCGLIALAEVIHDIDFKENKYNRSQTDGLNALLTGLAVSEPDDEERMIRGAALIENLYAFFQKSKQIDTAM